MGVHRYLVLFYGHISTTHIFNMKIYILQEDQLVSKLLKKSLENQDHEVKLFTHAIEFSEAVEDNKPDLVIIDLLVSYIAGYELISNIRRIPNSYIKIVVLSKVNSQNAIQEAFSLGVDEYIITPFQINTVLARVNRLSRYSIQPTREKVVFMKTLMVGS